jgi:PDZ domain
MNVIPFNRKPAREAESLRTQGFRNSGVVLLLAATLAAGAGTAVAGGQVERDDVAKPVPPAPPAVTAPPVPPVPSDSAAKGQKDRDRDARLEDAKRRLEAAAAEVAALSSEIASEAMQSFSTFTGGSRRAIIGVVVEPAESGSGARVKDVSPGGAAEQAGIRVGDVIVALNGTTVKDGAREVVRLLRKVEPDSTVQVRVMRDGKPKDFKVTARRFEGHAWAYSPPNFDFDFDFDFDPLRDGQVHGFTPGAFRGALGGMEVTTLTPQLARYFGADEGLLVLRAPKGDVYKLQDGDVILNIDGRIPSSGSHVARILRSYQPGEKLTLRIMRDRKPLDLQVTLPENERSRRVERERVRALRVEPETTI